MGCVVTKILSALGHPAFIFVRAGNSFDLLNNLLIPVSDRLHDDTAHGKDNPAAVDSTSALEQASSGKGSLINSTLVPLQLPARVDDI